jgi:dipeptidyl aminopeptidase/acylaminoacyl peptidase
VASKTAPYGTWSSPITMDVLLTRSVGVGQPAFDGDHIYFVESRPQDQGRNVVVQRKPDGQEQDVTPPALNVRTRAHEYGGRSYLVREGTVWFSNFTDQRLYRQVNGGEAEAVTAPGDVRYADLAWDGARDRLLAVREDHTTGAAQAVTTLVALKPDRDTHGTVLVSGHDFFSNPRVSPDGRRALWLAWNHSNMPWDGTELWVADIDAEGRFIGARQVAGGPQESIYQPEWSPDGVITFASDRTGWWNLYRLEQGRARNLAPRAAEFGRPAWSFGSTSYAYVDEQRLLVTYYEGERWHLALMDVASGALRTILSEYTFFGGPMVQGGGALVLAASWNLPPRLLWIDLTSTRATVIKETQTVPVSEEYLSPPEPIAFPTTGGQTAYAFFYPPRNPEYQAPAALQPPLVVFVHGGPTGHSDAVLDLEKQYWTTRGFAVVDVNYGGSSGYGRAYRERLLGQWGVVDVDDSVNAVRYLARTGRVDGERTAIRGGSAGGYTTLACLTFRDVFHAGASYFGVSDCGALARETHKFESHYLDRLIGPWPEAEALYRERSPLFHAEDLRVPVIFFQGLDDKVVPPNQAELMVEDLKRRGVPVAYLAFPGEGHGFRRAENIKRSQEAELYFFGRVFGFAPADPLDPVPIANMD